MTTRPARTRRSSSSIVVLGGARRQWRHAFGVSFRGPRRKKATMLNVRQERAEQTIALRRSASSCCSRTAATATSPKAFATQSLFSPQSIDADRARLAHNRLAITAAGDSPKHADVAEHQSRATPRQAERSRRSSQSSARSAHRQTRCGSHELELLNSLTIPVRCDLPMSANCLVRGGAQRLPLRSG